MRRIIFLVLLILTGRSVTAQQLQGVVTDSARHEPIAGAVVIVMNDARLPITRAITNQRGQYFVALDSAARTLRVIRLGYRAREFPLGSDARASMRRDIVLTNIPALLEPVRVTAAAGCEKRKDSDQAYSLLEQARAGLLATIVARETKPSAIKMLMYERELLANGKRIDKQSVRVDSSGNRTKSFESVATARDFATKGFAIDSAGSRVFYGPDAEVLLDDALLEAYCIRIESAGRERPNQVGLGFAAAQSRTDRVDIDGVLWIDTAAKTLKDFQFRYVGTRPARGINTPNGHIWFREMPNGVVFIDRWFLSLFGAKTDTVPQGRTPYARVTYFERESGGEVARASWPDGMSWKGSQGTVRLRVVDSAGKPALHTTVRFANTDYIGSPDAHGNLEITDVLPGPYDVRLVDALTPISPVTIGTDVKIFAFPDSVIAARIVVPPHSAFQKVACVRNARAKWVVAEVVRNKELIPNAEWEIGEELGTSAEFVSLTGITGADGTFGFCHVLSPGMVTQVRVKAPGEGQRPAVVALEGRLEKMTISLP